MLPNFRPWAEAEEPPAGAGGSSAPSAPFALDGGRDADSDFRSEHKASFGAGWNPRLKQSMRQSRPAGLVIYDGFDAAACTHNSGWDAPDWKALQTSYMTDNEAKALARHHRKLQKNGDLPQDAREARWRRCFQQWSAGQEAASVVTGTDFSILPAGFASQHLGRPRPPPGDAGGSTRPRAPSAAPAPDASRPPSVLRPRDASAPPSVISVLPPPPSARLPLSERLLTDPLAAAVAAAAATAKARRAGGFTRQPLQPRSSRGSRILPAASAAGSSWAM